jgi:hypothetical protein
MKNLEVTMPEIGLIAGTRGMLGAGIGLLLADKINEDRRKAIGWTLFIIGALSTIPLAIEVLSKKQDRTEDVNIAEPRLKKVMKA